MKTALLTLLVLLHALPDANAQAPALSGAPKAIQELASAIQGNSPEHIRAAMIEKFGPVQRDVGSGLQIEQWDVADGVLTFHPLTGPVFSDSKTKNAVRLLRTHNTAGDVLLQSYEMTTLPDAANHGTRFWLGNIQFGPGKTYKFTDSTAFPDQRDAQKGNFFLQHPTGTVEVRYSAPVTSHTLLESLPDGSTIAHLVFTSNDHQQRATFSVTSSERERRLSFGGETPLSFRMEASWKNFWR